MKILLKAYCWIRYYKEISRLSRFYSIGLLGMRVLDFYRVEGTVGRRNCLLLGCEKAPFIQISLTDDAANIIYNYNKRGIINEKQD